MLAKEVVSGVINEAFNSRVNALNAMRVLGIDTSLLVESAPVDDEIPPNGVTGLVVTSIYNGLALSWDEPPPEDAVRKSVIEITPDGESPFTQEVTTIAEATVFGLEAIPHTVRVQLIDEWDRTSAWSGTEVATPISTAEADIDLAYKQAQGTLQGLIDAINIAGPTAEQGIQAVALAATLANNMLPLAESDMEMWAPDTAWVPAAAVQVTDTVAGTTAAFIGKTQPTGHTLSMERKNGNWQIKHVRTTSSNNYVYYQNKWIEQRRVQNGERYIAQATVTGTAGTVVSIAVENADNDVGLNLTTANEAQFTLGGGTQRISVAFDASTKPYVRLRLGLHNDNATVWWHKFMLEHAKPGGTEASPWNAGVVAAGAVAAHSLTAITANIANGVFAEAAIQSAHINTLKADKIVSGSLVSNVVVSTGMVKAGGAVMDKDGLYLVSQNINPEGDGGSKGFPTGNTTGDWITSNPASGGTPKPYAGIAFFDDTNDPKRGVLIRTRGVTGGGNRDGFISLLATSGGTDIAADSSAYINIRAANPGSQGIVSIGHKLIVAGDIDFPANSITNTMIKDVSANTINGKISKDNLPNLNGIDGKLDWGKVDHPDFGDFAKKSQLDGFITSRDLNNKDYVTQNQVEGIVRSMVKDNSRNR